MVKTRFSGNFASRKPIRFKLLLKLANYFANDLHNFLI